MKKALLILLVVVVVVTGIPLMAGMSGAAGCRDCGPAVAPLCIAAVLAAGVALAIGLLGLRLWRRPRLARPLLHSFVLERPPRLA